MCHPTLDELPPPPPGRIGWPWTEASPRLPETMPDGTPWPKISIVTPSYNQGAFIEETIRSVLLQGYPNLEYIVIDGGSTDESAEVIEKYASWFDYWVSEEDRGQTHAINKGLGRCTGDIFNWINSDDLFAPDAFRVVAEQFVDKGGEVVCGFNRHFHDDTGETAAHVRVRLSDTLEKTIVYGHFRQTPTFYRFNVLRPLGALDESLDFVMDEELWLRYLLAHGQDQIAFTDEVLAHFRLHSSSKTVSQSGRFQEEMLELMEILRSVVEADGSNETTFSKDGDAHQALRTAARRRSLHDRRLLSYLYQNRAAHRVQDSRIESFVLMVKALLYYPFRSFAEYRRIIGILLPSEVKKPIRMLRASPNQ